LEGVPEICKIEWESKEIERKSIVREQYENKRYWLCQENNSVFYTNETGKALSDDKLFFSMEEAFTLLDSDGDDKIPPSSPGILMPFLGDNPTQAQPKSIFWWRKPHITFQFLFVFGSLSKRMKPESFNQQLHEAIKVLYKYTSGLVCINKHCHILTIISKKIVLHN